MLMIWLSANHVPRITQQLSQVSSLLHILHILLNMHSYSRPAHQRRFEDDIGGHLICCSCLKQLVGGEPGERACLPNQPDLKVFLKAGRGSETVSANTGGRNRGHYLSLIGNLTPVLLVTYYQLDDYIEFFCCMGALLVFVIFCLVMRMCGFKVT